jgi:hypothetical protein
MRWLGSVDFLHEAAVFCSLNGAKVVARLFRGKDLIAHCMENPRVQKGCGKMQWTSF